MPSQTSRKAATAQPEQETPEPARITAQVWAAGDGALQIALAGLLADQPELVDQEHPVEEWRRLLNDYLLSERQ